MSDNLRVGWRATAGSLDKGEMIALFQTALKKEIGDLKKGKGGWQFDVYDGKRVYLGRELYIYRFLTDAVLKDDTPVDVIVNGQPTDGYVVSSDPEGINIGLHVDRGESIRQATIHSSAYKLLEDLVAKLNKVRSGDISLNLEGSMKLFGFLKPNRLSNPVPFSDQITEGYAPNGEQQVAILSSLTHEVTFIWGPPGTGKTKTLGIILNQLIKAGKSVLLTSHTNAAVDEILKKFVENEENTQYIEAAKIIRIGIPSLQNNSLNALLIDNILEEQTSDKQKKIEKLRVQIDTINKKIERYKVLDEEARAIETTLRKQTLEYEREEARIANLQQKISTLNMKNDKLTTNLSDQHQLLEKAKTAGFLRRILSGLNVERIERNIETLETELKISELEMQSSESELEDTVTKRSAISSKTIESKNRMKKIVSLDGVASLESLQKRARDLSQEVKDKELEMKEIQDSIEKLKEDIFNNALAVGCTITRACLDSKIFSRKFDVLIIDEASMATLPNVFFVSGLSLGHYIISGDFRQLSPISASNSETAAKWLKRDIFVQAGIVESVNSNVDDERVVMLREQYRMHPDICALISDAVYGGKLKTSEETKKAKQQIAALAPFEDKALIFCDTTYVDPWIKRPKTSHSRLSPYSAAVSARLASILLEEGKKKGVEPRVGIVTPYSAQAKLISKILEDEHSDPKYVVASTIHRFQGNEREYVIFDLVEGHPFSPGILTKGSFTNSEPGKIITVAISRAEGKFILVGNSRYIRSKFNTNDAIFQVMEKIRKDGVTIDSLSVLSPTFGVEIEGRIIPRIGKQLSASHISILNEKNFYEIFCQELKTAKSSVVVFSPFLSRRRLRKLIKDFKSSVKKGIKIYIITRHPDYQGTNKREAGELIEQMRKTGIKVLIASKKIGVHERFHDKIAVVDNSVFYHGSMNILSQTNSSESMIAFRSRGTIEELAKNFDIKGTIRKYQNLTGEDSSTISIIRMIEQKLLENLDLETCPQCGQKLVLVKGKNNLYFGCPNSLDKGCSIQKEVDKSLIKQAISSMKLKCGKCLRGYMIYQEGKFGPFLSCDQYHESHCKSTMNFDDDPEN